MKNLYLLLCMSLASLFASPAFAVVTPIDTAVATDNIAAAQTAVLAVIAAMTAFVIAKWAVVQIKRLFGR
jgi:hypothetical protein